jgi:hypothetical protein
MSEENKLTIYGKLIKARIEIQKNKLKMTGKNTYSNYNYYKMSDILPAINKAEFNNGLCSVFVLNENNPILTIYDIDGNDKIEMTMPYAEAQMKGAPKIHNLGASCMYTQRYLLLMAYGISENDFVDSDMHIVSKKVSREQVNSLEELLLKTKTNIDNFKKYIAKTYKKSDLIDLNLEEYLNLWVAVEKRIPTESDAEKELDSLVGNTNNTGD